MLITNCLKKSESLRSNSEIHKLFMKHFKIDPENRSKFPTHSFLLNKSITINIKLIYWKTWEDAGLYVIKDILDKDNNFLSCKKLIKIQYPLILNETLQTQTSIRSNGLESLKILLF